MPFTPALLDLAIVLAAAAGVAFVFQRLKQPVVMGYILAGALIGPYSPFTSSKFDLPSIHFWADLGIIFLMFHLGLEFSFRRLFRSGLTALWVGAVEVTAMFVIGSLIARAWLAGFGAPAFLGAMVAISSTTIIVKAIDELGLKNKRFAENVYGLLIVEDLAAVLLIVILTSSASGRVLNESHLLYLMAELIVVVGGWFLIGSLILPRLMKLFEGARVRELLTLCAIGLCLLVSVAAASFGYSLALGAFITGSVIAETAHPERIAKMVHPLKDIFGAVFFVSVGMLVNFAAVLPHWPLVAALSVFVYFGKLLTVTAGYLSVGESFQTSLRSGLAMGQIGEFSFIIAALGLSSGQIQPDLQPIVVAVAIVTAFATPYSIRSSGSLADLLLPWMPRRLLSLADRYRARLHAVRHARVMPEWMGRAAMKFLVNGIVIALVFGTIHRHFAPWISREFLKGNLDLALAVSLIGAILICAPLLFAMVTCAGRGSRSVLFPLATLLWLAALGSWFVPAWIVIASTLSVGLILLLVFQRNLSHSYEWLEKSFLSGLKPSDDIGQFAPWDAHLVRMVVHPNSRLSGCGLGQTDLRHKHGLSVIAIRRGERLIALPERDEKLYPFDELLLLGTDEQIEGARSYVEMSTLVSDDPAIAFGSPNLSHYEMRSFRLVHDSHLVSRRIRETHLREENGEWVVGVEHDGKRILNPSPEFKLSEGDVVWIVGPRL